MSTRVEKCLEPHMVHDKTHKKYGKILILDISWINFYGILSILSTYSTNYCKHHSRPILSLRLSAISKLIYPLLNAMLHKFVKGLLTMHYNPKSREIKHNFQSYNIEKGELLPASATNGTTKRKQ